MVQGERGRGHTVQGEREGGHTVQGEEGGVSCGSCAGGAAGGGHVVQGEGGGGPAPALNPEPYCPGPGCRVCMTCTLPWSSPCLVPGCALTLACAEHALRGCAFSRCRAWQTAWWQIGLCVPLSGQHTSRWGEGGAQRSPPPEPYASPHLPCP